jgi:hypothetical protein
MEIKRVVDKERLELGWKYENSLAASHRSYALGDSGNGA